MEQEEAEDVKVEEDGEGVAERGEEEEKGNEEEVKEGEEDKEKKEGGRMSREKLNKASLILSLKLLNWMSQSLYLK